MTSSDVMTSRPTLPTPLVSTDWLEKHLGDPDLRVLDATTHLGGTGAAQCFAALFDADGFLGRSSHALFIEPR